MSKLLDGQVALITGGSSGIGRAAALALAAEGARVVVAGRRADRLTETVRLIEACGGEAISAVADVTKATEIEALVAKTVETYGALNCVFNNAGIEGDPYVPLAEYSETTWTR